MKNERNGSACFSFPEGSGERVIKRCPVDGLLHAMHRRLPVAGMQTSTSVRVPPALTAVSSWKLHFESVHWNIFRRGCFSRLIIELNLIDKQNYLPTIKINVYLIRVKEIVNLINGMKNASFYLCISRKITGMFLRFINFDENWSFWPISVQNFTNLSTRLNVQNLRLSFKISRFRRFE